MKPLIEPLDVSTRAKRRKAVAAAVELLEKILAAEEGYMERMPENLQSGEAYDAAGCSVDIIIDAISGLSDAY
jgi:hypothetical protein